MPRWPDNYVPRTKQTCPSCGGPKDFYAKTCRGCNVPKKPLLGKTGESHPAWKTGQRIDKDGYIKTYCPDHPWPRRGGYVFEHVRVMELHLGRRITADESVHHKDEDKQNNALENLELMKRGEHSRHHRKKDTKFRNRISGRFAGKEVCP